MASTVLAIAGAWILGAAIGSALTASFSYKQKQKEKIDFNVYKRDFITPSIQGLEYDSTTLKSNLHRIQNNELSELSAQLSADKKLIRDNRSKLQNHYGLGAVSAKPVRPASEPAAQRRSGKEDLESLLKSVDPNYTRLQAQQQSIAQDEELTLQQAQQRALTYQQTLEKNEKLMLQQSQQKVLEKAAQQEALAQQQAQPEIVTMEEVFRMVKQLRITNPQFFTYNRTVGRFDAVVDKDAPYILGQDNRMLPNEVSSFRATRLQGMPYECNERIVTEAHKMLQFCQVDSGGTIQVTGKIGQ